jgi:hypothetical protein
MRIFDYPVNCVECWEPKIKGYRLKGDYGKGKRWW